MSSSTSESLSGGAPSEALLDLLAPDGYYTYLGIPKPVPVAPLAATAAAAAAPEKEPLVTIDEDLVKKSYRKLSRKHHPDKPGGDADTFRVLNRAYRVLSNAKLRQQYDILGIDLDDDEEDTNESDAANSQDEGSSSAGQEKPSTAQGIVHDIASMVMTGLMQLAIRTLMLGTVAVFVVRYRLFVYPIFCFLVFVAYQIVRSIQAKVATYVDLLSPLGIMVGIWCMHITRRQQAIAMATANKGTQASDDTNSVSVTDWTWTFGFGEATVIALFTWNSLTTTVPKTNLLLGAVAVFACFAELVLRGRFWNYSIVFGLEAALVLFVALAFPVMELILEAILNEKLTKVGDKVRAHHRHLKAYYAHKEKTRST